MTESDGTSGVGGEAISPANPTLGEESKRRHPRSRYRGSKKPVTTMPKAAPFKGMCEDLNGHVYDCSASRQTTDAYTKKTTREIAAYVGRTYRYRAGTKRAIENLVVQPAVLPEDP
jgi:hypothetical protein